MADLLLVVDSLGIGGAERHVVDLAIAMQRRGYGVTVACSAGGPLQPELEQAGIPVRLLGSQGPIKRRVSRDYASWLRGLVHCGSGSRFDLIHAHGYASMVAAASVARVERVPLLVTAHSEGIWQGEQERGIASKVYRRATGVIAVSPEIGRRLIGEDGVPPERVSFIPNAIPARSTQRAPRTNGAPLVAVIARLEPEKGVDLFLRAASRIASQERDARFVVIGDGSERAALVAQTRRLGLERHIQFLGAQPDARTYLSTFDVLAVPSRSEGSPLVVLEAMAAGVPIAAAAVGGIREQIRNGREGLLTLPDDAATLAGAVCRLLADRDLARRLAFVAQQRSRSQLSHDGMLGRVEACYKASLGGLHARERAG